MKALTLYQPWASLIAIGAKQFETRSWPAPRTAIGDVVAIHAGHKEDRSFRWEDDEVLSILGSEDLPKGAIVATGRLIKVLPTWSAQVSSQERHLGDYSTGRYAWRFAEVVQLTSPMPAKGHLGLWTVPEDLVNEILWRSR